MSDTFARPSLPYPTKLPFVSMDEDGTMYFAEGHVDPWRFLVGVLCDLAENCGHEEVMGLLGGEHWKADRAQTIQDWITSVKYSYFKVADDFTDHMEKCAPDDEGAMAYTQVFL